MLHTWVTLGRNQIEGMFSDDERGVLKWLRNETNGLRLEKEMLKMASAFFAKNMS